MGNLEVLENCIKYQELCSGRKIDSNVFSLENYSDWTTKDAVDSLSFDKSGYTAILLMRKAWREFCERKLSITQLLEPEYQERIKNFNEYNNYLATGEGSQIYNNLIDSVKELCSKFGVTKYENILNNDVSLIDIFSSTFKSIYKEYKVDRFKCNDNKTNYPTIITKEVHVKTLQNIVDILRRSDNCITYAKVDMVSEVNDPTDYDIFFAFACRCGEYIYVLSDRNVDANPKARKSKLNRNPAKDLRDKAAFSYMPYYSIRDNEGDNKVSNSTALISIEEINKVEDWKQIKDIYDSYAQLSIIIGIFAVYNKYFINHTVDLRYNNKKGEWVPIEDSYFASEIKLLPSNINNTKELILPESIALPIPTFDKLVVVPDSMYFSDVDFYDKYVKRWCTEEDFKNIPELPDFVAPITEVKEWVWWLQRDKARKICNERMLKDYVQHFYSRLHWVQDDKLVPYEIEFRHKNEGNENELYDYGDLSYRGWGVLKEEIPSDFAYCKDYNIVDDIGDHIKNVLNYILTVNEIGDCGYWDTKNNSKVVDKLKLNSYHNKDANIRCEHIARNSYDYYLRYNDLDHKNQIIYTKSDIPVNVVMYRHNNQSIIYIIPKGGTESKKICLSLQIDSIDQLKLLLQEDNEHFPEWLREWRHYATHTTHKPYCGNSLLDMTDPMENVVIPTDYNLHVNIEFYASISDIKKLKNTLGI